MVRDVVEALAKHERRVTELRGKIRGLEAEIDDTACALYGLDGSDRAIIDGFGADEGQQK